MSQSRLFPDWRVGCEECFHFPVLPVCPRIEVCNRHGVSKRSTEPTRCFNFLFGTSHSTCSTYTVYQFFCSTNPTQQCSVQTCSCFQRMSSPYFFSPPALPMTIDGLPRICFNAYLVLLIIPWLPWASARTPLGVTWGDLCFLKHFPGPKPSSRALCFSGDRTEPDYSTDTKANLNE
jgi:hypothetical protein